MDRDDGGARGRFGLLKNRALLTLMLGHFTVDLYVGLLPVLYPLLTERFDLDLKTVGLVSLAYTGLASLSQPLFGWLGDRYGTRFTGLALAWTAVTFSTIGFAPNFGVLLILAAFAGLGSGAFHPLGSMNARVVIPAAQRNAAMSVYVTGGTLGVAAGPLVGIVLFGLFGVRGTAAMLLPGAGIAVWLLAEMRTMALRRPAAGAAREARGAIPVAALAVVVGLMMARMWTLLGLQAFIPIWYRELGYGPAFYGPLATTIVLSSAVGAVGAGTLADRHGRRTVLLVSLVLSLPAILLFAEFPGPFAFVSAALVGLLAASTAPLLLVLAQELMGGRAGLASGLILGIGFVTGAIGVPVTGALADAIGLQAAIRAQALVVVLTIGLAWLLPTEERVRALRARAAEPGPAATLAS